MKKNSYSFFLLVALGFILGMGSCNKDRFNDTERETEFVIESVPFSIPATIKPGESDSIAAFYFKVNMDSFVKKVDGRFDTTDIRTASLNSCVLTLDDNSTADNFSNLHTCTIGMTTARIPRIVRIATKTDIVDTPAYVLNIPNPYRPELRELMMADSVHYCIYGNIRKSATAPITGRARLVFYLKLSKQ